MERDLEPQLYDRILIVRQPWLGLILAGQKTMEVRGKPLSPGRYWLGYKSNIYGVVRLGTAIRIQAAEAWNECYPEHLVDLPMAPYKQTYGLPILSARPTRLIRYVHPQGAIGVVKFRINPKNVGKIGPKIHKNRHFWRF